jgi:S-formylglutathione hydrolase
MRTAVVALVLLMVTVIAACSGTASPAVMSPPSSTSTSTAPSQPTIGPSALATASPIVPASATAEHPSLDTYRVDAVSLASNLVGDSAARDIVVYLPPAYFSTQKHFPVVYYLPGFEDSGMTGFSLPNDLDTLVKGGRLTDTIVVVASGTNRLGGSFYVNSPVTGNWEDYIAGDVVSYVDGHFRTLARASSRGIAGHSMGGFGALSIAVHRPDLFGAVYAMSPGLFDRNGLSESQMFASDSEIESFLEFQGGLSGLSTSDAVAKTPGSQTFTVAYGLAFAPNAKAQPLPLDYPVRKVNGTLVRDDAVWLKWQAGFGGLAATAAHDRSSWLKLRGIVVDYGTNDEYAWIPKGCVYFGQQLTAAGIPVKVESFDGSHQARLGERIGEHMLPFFSATLESE